MSYVRNMKITMLPRQFQRYTLIKSLKASILLYFLDGESLKNEKYSFTRFQVKTYNGSLSSSDMKKCNKNIDYQRKRKVSPICSCS